MTGPERTENVFQLEDLKGQRIDFEDATWEIEEAIYCPGPLTSQKTGERIPFTHVYQFLIASDTDGSRVAYACAYCLKISSRRGVITKHLSSCESRPKSEAKPERLERPKQVHFPKELGEMSVGDLVKMFHAYQAREKELEKVRVENATLRAEVQRVRRIAGALRDLVGEK